MIRLNKEAVLSLHAMMCERTGGDPNVRDMGLLESALEAPFQTFGGEELYPTLEKKAARLGHSLIANHAFVDGNKRIGMLAMLVFLRLNGSELDPDDSEIIKMGLAVASGESGFDDLLDWLK